MRLDILECCTKAKWPFVINRLTIIASPNDKSEVSLVMPVNGSVFQTEGNSFTKPVSSILNPLAIFVCNFLTIHVLMLWLYQIMNVKNLGD